MAGIARNAAEGRRDAPNAPPGTECTVDEGVLPTALVHARRSREQIVRLLRAQQLDPFSYATIAELEEGSSVLAPQLIVIVVDGVDSPLVKQLGSLSKRFEGTPVLLVCDEIQRWEMRSVLACGVAGVVLADDLTTALGPCVRAILARQVCVPKQHWRQLAPPVLSSREKQILGLVVMGYMNGQIAQHLYLAESTVKSHLSSAFTKLGVRSRNEAVELILDAERGYGIGILALGGEPLDRAAHDARTSGNGSRYDAGGSVAVPDEALRRSRLRTGA